MRGIQLRSRLPHPTGPTRGILLASVATLLVLASSCAVTIWRYSAALNAKSAEVTARANDVRARQAVTVFWRERESMNEYLIQPNAQLAAEVVSERRELHGLIT